MYAIACKFPDQKRFKVMDVNKGEQVGKWVYCTLFKNKERANEVMEKIKTIVIPGVELKVVKYYNH